MSSPGSRAKKAALRLRLFIAGEAPNSLSALQNLRELIASRIAGGLEVVSVEVSVPNSALLRMAGIWNCCRSRARVLQRSSNCREPRRGAGGSCRCAC